MRATFPFVKERFDRFNREIFNNTLPPLRICINHSHRTLGLFKCKNTRVAPGVYQSSDPQISISDLFDMEERMIEDTIIHEMIHYSEWLKHPGPLSEPHGIYFRSEMTRINQNFGRNISISEKLDKETISTANRNTVNVIGIFTNKEGTRYFTKIAKSRFFELYDRWKANGYDVKWYFSYTSKLVCFKRVTNLSYYPLSAETENVLLNPSALTTPITVYTRNGNRYMEADTSVARPLKEL